MTSLEDAWDWYQAARRQLRMMQRLGQKYWDLMPWDGDLGRDPQLGTAEGEEVVRATSLALAPLDDLAVVVLFSVFESAVRVRVLAEVEPEVAGLKHPTLRHAANEVKEGLAEGSFFRVLEPFKVTLDPGLVEQVNQVRKYRNWVAHGRRGPQPAAVSPDVAFDRLSRFLAALPAATPE